MFVTLMWKDNPTGRHRGMREPWDMSSQGELAEQWQHAGYCDIEYPKIASPVVESVEAAPADRSVKRLGRRRLTDE